MKSRHTFIEDHLVDNPSGRLIWGFLVPVDFLLLKSPIWQGLWMGPQRDLRWNMEKLEVPRLAFPNLPFFCFNQLYLKKSVVVSRMVIFRPGCKFLIGGHERARNIMREEVSLGGNVQKLDHVIVTHQSTTACVRKGLRGDDLPMVIGVRMLVTSNLLPCRRISTSGTKQKRVYSPLLLIRPSSYTNG